MRPPHRSPNHRIATSWLLVLAIVFGAFAPGWHALANAGSTLDPSRELCSVYGLSTAVPGEPAPASSPDGASHCTSCLSPLLAGLLPADVPGAVPAAATDTIVDTSGPTAPASAPRRWTAPRGPPAQA